MALEASNAADYLTRSFAAEEQHPVLGFPKEAASRTGFRYFTPKDLGTATDRAAAHYIAHGLPVREKGDRPLVVGLWGPGTVEWVASLFAVVVMGHTALVLSSRLSGDVAEALMKKAHGDVLLCSPSLSPQSKDSFRSLPFVSTKQLEETTAPTTRTQCGAAVIDENDLAWISHSSGSTGLPKLFEDSHSRGLDRLRRSTSFFPPESRDWVASAVYNAVGLRMLLISVVKTQPLVFDNDRLPFTSEGLLGVLEEVRPNVAYMTSYTLELIATHPRGIDGLSRCDAVSHFGAVLPKELGDRLAQRGVNLQSAYGMSEAGLLLSSDPRLANDIDWDYMAPTSLAKGHLLFRPIGTSGSDSSPAAGDQLYELICLATCPGVNEEVMTSNDPPGSYHTGDLFSKHPSKDQRWKIVGRMDDQLKIYHQDRQAVVNGLEYEERIKRGNDDLIDEVVLFGQGESKLGVLVFAESATGQAKRTVTERVWASIDQEINQKMKIGIEKNMIVVVSGVSTLSLPRTTKLNFIRPQIYKKYKKQIEAAYHTSHMNGHSKF